jgi:diadenosine tetraphosphate (Ap4A) HIT family hydrolase
MERIICPFCSPEKGDITLENEVAYARYDKYPVNPGHMLVIPHRHFPDLFEASPDELNGMWDLIQRSKMLVDTKYSPDGFNVGMNVGEAAGQTVMHLHIHLIPRYKGDISNPRGGIRDVIPAKQSYL